MSTCSMSHLTLPGCFCSSTGTIHLRDKQFVPVDDSIPRRAPDWSQPRTLVSGCCAKSNLCQRFGKYPQTDQTSMTLDGACRRARAESTACSREARGIPSTSRIRTPSDEAVTARLLLCKSSSCASWLGTGRKGFCVPDH